VGAAGLLLLALAAVAGARPDLPAVPLDDLPEEARQRVGEAYRRARSRPDDVLAVGELAMLLHAYEQVGLAEGAYARARALDPGSADWPYLHGLVQARLGKAGAARESFAEAVARAPEAVAVRVRLGELLLAAGDLEAAAAHYDALVRDRPRLPQAHYGQGRIAAARGRSEAAAVHYQEACRLFEPYGAAHYALGLVFRDLGRPEEAQRHLTLYAQHRLTAPPLDDPAVDRVRARQTGAGVRLAEGVRRAQVGDLEGAVRAHLEALAIDAQLVQAHANLISLYGRARRFTEAEQHYRAAVAAAPGLAEAHYDYGVLLKDQGRRAEAAEAFRLALSFSPRYAQAHHNLGLLLEAEGRRPEAAEHYRQAVANQAGYREARFNLGRVLVALGQPREAAAELEQILTPETEATPTYLFALAAALVRAGERDRALQYARQAQQRAEAFGQHDLAATIARDIKGLEQAPPP
jgi:tetratricopeptide (TPR) repeat protein